MLIISCCSSNGGIGISNSLHCDKDILTCPTTPLVSLINDLTDEPSQKKKYKNLFNK